jgi:hypothetical protein
MSLVVVVLAAAVWSGTARVDVMSWEGGGEHPYQTDFELRYREEAPTELRNTAGRLVGHHIRLAPERIALKVWHQVRGLLNCIGAGQEEVTEDPGSAIVTPLRHEALAETVGVAIPPSGAYQLVLPRAYGAYACGQGNRNRGNRRVGIGSRLLSPDVEFDDREVRFLDAGGGRMRGTYTYRRSRSADGSVQHLVRKEIRVEWDLRRSIEP